MGSIIVAAFILVFVILGAKKGFARALVGALSSFLSIIIGVFIYRPVSSVLNKVGLKEWLESFLGPFFGNNTNVMSNSKNTFVQSFEPEIISMTAVALLNIVCFIVITILSKIIIVTAIKAMNVTTRLPIIKEINFVLGGIIGLLSGSLLCYILCGVIGAMTVGGSFGFVADVLKNSELSNAFYENNLITALLSNFIK